MYEKIYKGEKKSFWVDRPSFFWRSSKMVKFGVKTPKMVIFSFFQLWELKTLIFSPPYGFVLFFYIFRPFLRKYGKISKLRLIFLIFWESALAKQKWIKEPKGMCHMANFRMYFDQVTWSELLGKVSRESEKNCSQGILKIINNNW